MNPILKALINSGITSNGVQAITGSILNNGLQSMITALGLGARYMGMATPGMAAPSTENAVFYLSVTPGTYTNLSGRVLSAGYLGVFTNINTVGAGAGTTWNLHAFKFSTDAPVIPDATTTQKGVVQLAKMDGTDTIGKAVTISAAGGKVASAVIPWDSAPAIPDATTTQKGVVQLAKMDGTDTIGKAVIISEVAGKISSNVIPWASALFGTVVKSSPSGIGLQFYDEDYLTTANFLTAYGSHVDNVFNNIGVIDFQKQGTVKTVDPIVGAGTFYASLYYNRRSHLQGGNVVSTHSQILITGYNIYFRQLTVPQNIEYPSKWTGLAFTPLLGDDRKINADLLSGGGGAAEPYIIQQIPSSPTNVQMITATGGAGNLQAAIEQGRPIYGYWGAPGNLGAILAASYASNVIFLVIPNATLTAFRCIMWSEGNDPTETTIGGGNSYATTGLYTLTGAATSETLSTAIGGWFKFVEAVDSGKTIIDTTAGNSRILYGVRKTISGGVTSLRFYMAETGDTQQSRKEVLFELVNTGGGSLVLSKATYRLLSDENIAANTGDSTDAGKVPVLGSNGKLSPNTYEGGGGASAETRAPAVVMDITEGGSGPEGYQATISGNYDIYEFKANSSTMSGVPCEIMLPPEGITGDTRRFMKVIINIENGMSAVMVGHKGYNDYEDNTSGAGLSKHYLFAQFEVGIWHFMALSTNTY